MATYTTKLNLKKPAEDDFFDITDFNGNTDILEATISARTKIPVNYTEGNLVKFTTDGQLYDSGKKTTDFMSATANYLTVGADPSGSAQNVANNLNNHIADSAKHFTIAERAKLAKTYTTDNIVVSATQPAVSEGRIWIKVG